MKSRRCMSTCTCIANSRPTTKASQRIRNGESGRNRFCSCDVDFQHSSMRSHLLQCLEDEAVRPFPTTAQRKRRCKIFAPHQGNFRQASEKQNRPPTNFIAVNSAGGARFPPGRFFEGRSHFATPAGRNTHVPVDRMRVRQSQSSQWRSKGGEQEVIWACLQTIPGSRFPDSDRRCRI